MIKLRSRSKKADPAVVNAAAINRIAPADRWEIQQMYARMDMDDALQFTANMRERSRKRNRKETRTLLWELLWFALTLGGMVYNWHVGNNWWVLFLVIAAAHAYVIRDKANKFYIAQQVRADYYEFYKHCYVTKR